jgi:hypothetical protein
MSRPAMNRRRLLTAAAGATALGSWTLPSPAVGALDPDAELLDLVRRLASLERSSASAYFDGMRAIEMIQLPRPKEDAAKLALWHQAQAEVAEADVIVQQIAAMPARTHAGLSAKAALLQRWLGDGWDVHQLRWMGPWERAAFSLAADILNMGAPA